MNAYEFLKHLHDNWCHFQSKEKDKIGIASNSELKRWFTNKAIAINGTRPNWNDEISFPIESFVLFPKHPITLR